MALMVKNAQLLNVQLIFQYVTCVTLVLNSAFSLAADFGGYNEEQLYAQRNPPLIRFLAFLSIAFLFVQLFLRVMTIPVFKFMRDLRKFKFVFIFLGKNFFNNLSDKNFYISFFGKNFNGSFFCQFF